MRHLAIAILLVACAPAQAVEISNFRSGLACTNTAPGNGETGWICHVTEDILVTDQGTCRYDGKDYPCTWVGFEFDYRNAKPGDTLECVAQQSQPTSFGNPDTELEANATSHAYSIKLDKREGHFYNPQYFTFVTRPPASGLLVETTRCAHQGKELFKYTFRVRVPEPPRQLIGT